MHPIEQIAGLGRCVAVSSKYNLRKMKNNGTLPTSRPMMGVGNLSVDKALDFA
jgi:hypothetical protein